MPTEQKRFWSSVWIVLLFVVAMWSVFLFQELAGTDFTFLANAPHRIEGLKGILFSPFVHGSWEHIMSNTLPFMVLLTVVINAYPKASFWVLLSVWLGSGTAVWLLGVEGSRHIGMSGVIYGLAFFLLGSALFTRHRVPVLIAVFVVVLYGTMAEGFLPKQGISWQSHLYGALCGVAAAFLFGRMDREYLPDNTEPEKDKRFFEEVGNSQLPR